MKRQGESISDQPPIKKPDASTDLRSKIGAKLQNLFNGINAESRFYARNRRRLYEDLFGEKHSEIIIDHPTIVIKTESPEVEECNDSSTLTSQNFLISAKSRLTELLNKQHEGTSKFKDSGKENTLSSSKNKSPKFCSSQTSVPSKSQSCSNNKKRNCTSKESSNSLSGAPNNQSCGKELIVVVEDIMNSKNKTKFTNLLPTKLSDCIDLSNEDSNLLNKQVRYSVNRNKGDLLNNTVDLCIDERSVSQLNTNSENYETDCCIIENNSMFNVSTSAYLKGSKSVLSNNYDASAAANVFPSTEENNQILYNNENDSELIDDPTIPQVIVDLRVEDKTFSIDGNSHLATGNPDGDVVLLCERTPTYEVITLEDNDDSKDVIEEVHECDQCGKAFRLKSLLNFHIRMHGSEMSPSSNSHSSS